VRENESERRELVTVEAETGENQYKYGTETLCLPQEVVDWAGLLEKDPTINERELSQINDQGTSFEKIADLIEENL